MALCPRWNAGQTCTCLPSGESGFPASGQACHPAQPATALHWRVAGRYVQWRSALRRHHTVGGRDGQRRVERRRASVSTGAEAELLRYLSDGLADAIRDAGRLPESGPGRSKPRQLAIEASAAGLAAYDVTILTGPGTFATGGVIRAAHSRLMAGRVLDLPQLSRLAKAAGPAAGVLAPEHETVRLALEDFAAWLDEVQRLLELRYAQLRAAQSLSLAEGSDLQAVMQAVRSLDRTQLEESGLAAYESGGTVLRSWAKGVKVLQEMLSTWTYGQWRFLHGASRPRLSMARVVAAVQQTGDRALIADLSAALRDPSAQALRSVAHMYAESVRYSGQDDLDAAEAGRRTADVFYWRVHQLLLLTGSALPWLGYGFSWQFPRLLHETVGGADGLQKAARAHARTPKRAKTTRGHHYIDATWASMGGAQ